jgi:hypothetical protein
MKSHPTTHLPPRRQRGVATLLIVLMVGLAVSVAAATSVYALRGAQSAQLTAHATTAAQANAWRGVEVLRQYLLQVDPATMQGWAKVPPTTANPSGIQGLDALGVAQAGLTGVTAMPDGIHYQITANVTGQAGTGSAHTTSTVQVVYNVVPGTVTPGTPPVIHSLPSAPMVFNGDLYISGGGPSGVVDPNQVYNYKDIAVAGNITIENASTATISGCTKGNANISGGGIIGNGHIYADGGITMGSLSFPTNTALWGNSITLNGGSGGPLTSVLAGAYQANVLDGSGNIIGTTQIGGTLLAKTAGGAGSAAPNGTIPWTQGTVLPVSTGQIVITLTSGSNSGAQFLLDLSKITTNASSGAITGASAAQWLGGGAASPTSGSTDAPTLPDALSFGATGIASYVDTSNTTQPGGAISVTSGASVSGFGTVWGNNVSIQSGSGNVNTLWAAGNAQLTKFNIASFTGGGNLQGTTSGGAGYPQIASGALAGTLRNSAGQTITPASIGSPLKVGQTGTSPGLPGLPYCDTRTAQVDASSFMSDANYVYQTVNGKAQLTIQNLHTPSGGPNINGVYVLSALTASQKTTLASLMTCGWGNDAGCLTVAQSGGTWQFSGVQKLPPGIMWFDNNVTINNNSVTVINGLITTGNVTLTTNGNNFNLVAPNFVASSQAQSAAQVSIASLCGVTYYPTNLCASSAALKTWQSTDATGATVTHTGMPIGNMAIIANGQLTAASWKIYGSVMLGGQFASGSSLVSILGSLSVGNNGTSSTTMKSGGVQVTVPNGSDLSQLPVITPGTPSSSLPASAQVLWSRYL